MNDDEYAAQMMEEFKQALSPQQIAFLIVLRFAKCRSPKY